MTRALLEPKCHIVGGGEATESFHKAFGFESGYHLSVSRAVVIGERSCGPR